MAFCGVSITISLYDYVWEAILVMYAEYPARFSQVPDSHTPIYARNKIRSESRTNFS